MYQYEVAKRVSHYMWWFDIHCVRVVSTLVLKQSEEVRKRYIRIVRCQWSAGMPTLFSHTQTCSSLQTLL